MYYKRRTECIINAHIYLYMLICDGRVSIVTCSLNRKKILNLVKIIQILIY